ncbi:MAG: dockerin type I repeat-containing protein [Planctomycetota bacterium]|nr:dockerin type I repeat-containing protein [Planctomycetota bacterium]
MKSIQLLRAIVGVVALVGGFHFDTASAFAQAGSDNCAAPTPITGTGLFYFNLTTATASLQGDLSSCLPPTGVIYADNDVWWCWTATCDGMVTLSTCGLTDVDTILAIYETGLLGCLCPANQSPICCNNNSCGMQSMVTCEVVCGQTYLIQVGRWMGSKANGSGQLRIECAGAVCAPAEPFNCNCCGGRPPIVDSIATPFAPGAVAVATNESPDLLAGAAVWLVGLGGQPSAPVGSNWNTGRYSHSTWTMANLGCVFGVTLDETGNIFVGQSSVYGHSTGFDRLGYAGAGAIYRLDGTTGAVTTVINLPQQIDPSQPTNEKFPGLGQLSYDCVTDRLFASNFEDGRIYCIDPTDTTGFKVRSTFKHGGAVTSALPNGNLADASDSAGFFPLGRRIWAVKAAGGRVFYSLWVEDVLRQNSGQSNQIWSVDIDASGNFIDNSERLECTLPGFLGANWSNPVADISFDDDCCLLAAERSMLSDTHSDAHLSRAFRFCQNAAGTWGAPTIYDTGGVHDLANATGGIGYQGGDANQIWNMADAIDYQIGVNFVYGLQGQDPAGEVVAQSTWIDLDGELVLSHQKYELGSLEISCVDACMTIVTTDISCNPSAAGPMEFDWTFTITNQSTQVAAVLILPDASFAPAQVLTLDPPLGPGASDTYTVHITGHQPLTQFCFPMVLGSVQCNICCSLDAVCLVLPECECFEDDGLQVLTAGVSQYDVTFALTNLETFAGEWISIAVAPGIAATVSSPTLINIPTTPYAGTVAVGPIHVISTLPPGNPITLIIGFHSLTFHPCCFREITFIVPPSGTTVRGDLNDDGIVNAADLAMLLAEWGSSNGAADINDDGIVNAADLAIMLANWG